MFQGKTGRRRLSRKPRKGGRVASRRDLRGMGVKIWKRVGTVWWKRPGSSEGREDLDGFYSGYILFSSTGSRG